MLNAWRALGHRNVTDEQVAFAEALVPALASGWPRAADVVCKAADDLADIFESR